MDYIGLYQHKAHRLFKTITEHADIFTRHENGDAVVYGDAIFDSNFKIAIKINCEKSTKLDPSGIDKFYPALQSLGVKKHDISGDPFKIKYCNVAPYSTHYRNSTPTKYEDEEEDYDEEDVRPPSHKYRVNKTKHIIFKLATEI